MLKIAVCDDLSTDLDHIAELIKEYLLLRSLCADIKKYTHPDALLKAMQTGSFHIFLLDMVMPMMSGIDLGRSIRRQNTDAQIIYITTESAFALDAYAVSPLHYLLKPVDRQALFNVLDMAAQKANYGEETYITIKTRDGLQTLCTDAVACCEYVRHTACYTLVNGDKLKTLTIAGSFAEHTALLLQNRLFIVPHAAFVVNMSCVTRLSREGFTLRQGCVVPVSGKQFTAVRNAYMSYRLGEG